MLEEADLKVHGQCHGCLLVIERQPAPQREHCATCPFCARHARPSLNCTPARRYSDPARPPRLVEGALRCLATLCLDHEAHRRQLMECKVLPQVTR